MLKVLQYSWALTAIVGFSIALYNLTISKTISQAVYMPLLVSAFCVLLFFLFKRQGKIKKENTSQNEQ